MFGREYLGRGEGAGPVSDWQVSRLGVKTKRERSGWWVSVEGQRTNRDQALADLTLSHTQLRFTHLTRETFTGPRSWQFPCHHVKEKEVYHTIKTNVSRTRLKLTLVCDSCIINQRAYSLFSLSSYVQRRDVIENSIKIVIEKTISESKIVTQIPTCITPVTRYQYVSSTNMQSKG